MRFQSIQPDPESFRSHTPMSVELGISERPCVSKVLMLLLWLLLSYPSSTHKYSKKVVMIPFCWSTVAVADGDGAGWC